jgi:hypothetical protein
MLGFPWRSLRFHLMCHSSPSPVPRAPCAPSNGPARATKVARLARLALRTARAARRRRRRSAWRRHDTTSSEMERCSRRRMRLPDTSCGGRRASRTTATPSQVRLPGEMTMAAGWSACAALEIGNSHPCHCRGVLTYLVTRSRTQASQHHANATPPVCKYILPVLDG